MCAWRSGTMARPGVVQVRPRSNSRPSCSGCGRRGPAYDRLEERRFEFVPLWGIVVFLAYRMRRVDCERCGVTVEMGPWGDGKNHLTTTYHWVAVHRVRKVESGDFDFRRGDRHE
jgi:transposase